MPNDHEASLPIIKLPVQFAVYEMTVGDDGLWNPTGEGPFLGALQVSLNASSEGYLERAAYFERLASLDTSSDPFYHEHHRYLRSIDGKTLVELIVRKDDPRMQPKTSGS